MATGDQGDFLGRLKAVLPWRWFPVTGAYETTSTPILDAVLAGLASAWATIYSLLSYAKLQTRIATATDVFLDIIGLDFFGLTLRRQANETDTQYRTRIEANLLRPRGTRPAMVSALTELTGWAPVIFEPAYPPDTGGLGAPTQLYLTDDDGAILTDEDGNLLVETGYTVAGIGLNIAGGIGSLLMPFECFVTAFRPPGNGISDVMGLWTGSGWAGGGLGIGAIEIASMGMIGGAVTDPMIQAQVNLTRPAATTVWMRITDAPLGLADTKGNPLYDTSGNQLEAPRIAG